MIKDLITDNYHGGIKYWKKNIKKKPLIFVVSDQEVHSDLLLKKFSVNSKNLLICFSAGEKVLFQTIVKRDFFIVDYHLNWVVKIVKNRGRIADLFKWELPNLEVVIMFLSHRLSFLSAMGGNIEKMMFKESSVIKRLSISENLLLRKNKIRSSMLKSVGAFILFLWLVITFPR